MKILTTMSFVLLLGMLPAALSHAASGIAEPPGLQQKDVAVQGRSLDALILAQQTKKGGEPEQQSKPDDHENMPGCRYRGGEDLQLLV
ncbi:MAG: hypothetical protein AAF346_07210 [Pseudomonadota bacterium]